MQITSWNEVQRAFEAICVLPAGQQKAAIVAMRDRDPKLAAIVAELLDADSQHSLLDASLSELAAAALSHDHVGDLIATQIGPYRLLRLLGEGGMGVVYLAERLDIGGYVAIKLLRDAWMSPMRRERFQLEQQSLARLHHPNIARIYDAGTLQGDTPWFVMEYVDGVPLTLWAETHKASLPALVDVMVQVVDAVAYAHRHALVHRDLKPSNILVNEAGEVRLLDFGIVKDLADSEVAGRSIDGLRPLSLGYAAPEQIRGGGIGLFTDVYAVGVLLHELLTGTLPELDGEGNARKPSRVARAEIVKARLPLTRAEWNDMDAICEKALESDAESRYASADALLQDLIAFREGRVLQARPHTFLHSAVKFIRRNRIEFAVLSIALLLLMTMAVVAGVRVTRSRDLALQQIARMARLRHFTESLFDGGNRTEGPSAELTIPMLLRRGEVEADGLHDDPQLQASMFSTLGNAYQRLGDLGRADVLLRRALDERRANSGSDRSQFAESLIDMGMLRRDQRRMDEAESFVRQAIAVQNKQGIRGTEAGRALLALGSVLALRGDYVQSESVLGRMIAQEKGETQQLADGLSELADVRFYLGDFPRSGELNRKALAIYRRTAGDGHPAVAHVTNSLGILASEQGHYAEAEKDFNASLALDQRWYGSANPVVAEDLAALAKVYSHTGREPQARASLLHALAIQEATFGHKHAQVASTLNDLGTMAYNRDMDDEAEKDFRDALGIWTELYGENHQFIGLAYANLAGVFMDRKNYPVAEDMARRALAIYEQKLTPDNGKLGVIHVKLGRILLREGKYAEAEGETRAGLRFFMTHETNEPSYLAGARKDMALIAAAEHKPELLKELATTTQHH
ncbi:serine/threonine-protein kinase [Terriglobus roseus]|uniref:Serine/threonine protein kinase n=1 Tax=Terriglobus roseus TaxID=392734 RepID=A0A1H4NT53_9BACT|nr:serine/threonine-protein kinase [Terriglobus roseus]SEB97822.1 serine/threonine protein kinase [Terriglobus roseus]